MSETWSSEEQGDELLYRRISDGSSMWSVVACWTKRPPLQRGSNAPPDLCFALVETKYQVDSTIKKCWVSHLKQLLRAISLSGEQLR